MGEAMAALIATDGSGATAWARSLATPGASLRDVADAVHALCALHGTAPGVIEQAREVSGVPAASAWLDEAAIAFVHERAMLATLVAAVGPLPSTPGQAQSEAAVTAQRNALAMLTRSDRVGCAIGAATALLLDWAAIRAMLVQTAERVGCALPPAPIPDSGAVTHFLGSLNAGASVHRAMLFGGQQLVAQHRGLWHLLEARASARRDG